MAGPCSSTQRQRSITRRGVAKRCWTVLCLTFVAGFVLHAIYISMSLSVLQQEDLLDFAGSLKKTVKQLLVNRSFCFFHCDKKIAWLMSFPNSGTTYTIANTEQISMLSTATNYAVECVQTNVLQPLYSYGYKSPFLFNPNLELPDEYVLTKTHCTGYCDHCHHSYLVQNFETFIDGCRTYTLQRECGTNQDKYSLWHVKKYIHLVRDPFDNIMARKHLGVSERRKEGYADRTKRTFDEAFLSKFDDSSGGLTAWCEFMDELFHTDSGGGPSSDDDDEDDEDGEVRTVEMLSEETLAIMKDVPCHSEWFRYV